MIGKNSIANVHVTEFFLIILSAAFIVSAFTFLMPDRPPVASAETRFVEKSVGGLAIVPASCASNPHYAGDCSGPPLGFCPAGTVDLDGSGCMCIATGLPPVGGICGQSFCPNGLTISQYPSCLCPAGQIQSGSVCITPQSCPNGLAINQYPSCTCPVGQIQSGSMCIGTGGGTCPNGLNISLYPSCSCPEGKIQSGSICVAVTNVINSCSNGLAISQYPSCLCPTGQIQSGVLCVPIQCTPTFYCVGNDLHHRGVQCVDDMPPQPCVYGCSGSSCNQPPPGDGKIVALPTLIRKNQTSIVSWQTSGMVEGSCTVREDNPDFVNSSTLPNGSFTTGSMAQQTIYTLTCTKLSGGSFVDRATISIIPIFEER